MSRSLSRTQALLLGLVVLAGLALGGWVLFRVGDRQRLWAETADLYAGFDSANGIEKGTAVRVRGVEAGQVVAIDLPAEDDPAGKVRIRLRLDKKHLASLNADAKARLLNEGMLGGRVINIDPGKDKTSHPHDGDDIAVVEAQDLSDVMQQAGATLKELRDSNGSLMKLVKSDEAHTELVGLVKDTRALVKQGQDTFREAKDAVRQTQEVMRKAEDTLTTLKQDAEAIKGLPLLRNYVPPDANTFLFRPDADRERRAFAATNLFEPGRAVLTEEGKMHLTNLAPWFTGFNKEKVSDAVVVSYASADSPELSPAFAQALTQRQSEVVVAYLRDSVKAHRTGWFSSRKVTSLGMGFTPPPVAEKDNPTHSRTEIIVCIPR